MTGLADAYEIFADHQLPVDVFDPAVAVCLGVRGNKNHLASCSRANDNAATVTQKRSEIIAGNIAACCASKLRDARDARTFISIAADIARLNSDNFDSCAGSARRNIRHHVAKYTKVARRRRTTPATTLDIHTGTADQYEQLGDALQQQLDRFEQRRAEHARQRGSTLEGALTIFSHRDQWDTVCTQLGDELGFGDRHNPLRSLFTWTKIGPALTHMTASHNATEWARQLTGILAKHSNSRRLIEALRWGPGTPAQRRWGQLMTFDGRTLQETFAAAAAEISGDIHAELARRYIDALHCALAAAEQLAANTCIVETGDELLDIGTLPPMLAACASRWPATYHDNVAIWCVPETVAACIDEHDSGRHLLHHRSGQRSVDELAGVAELIATNPNLFDNIGDYFDIADQLR